jgi:Fibronectin type III domain
MPTISQLPLANQVTAADEVPLSQGGATNSVSVGALLAGTQPAIIIPTDTLLGRTSLGPGGPEAVNIGSGLALNAASLAATGADHGSFALQPVLQPSDQAVISSSGLPKLLELSLLRGLFSAGSNIAIDPSGTISAAGSGSIVNIATLPTATSIGSNDLVAINQSGSDLGISYADFLDGQTIDAAQPALPASSEDTFWVAQGTSTMVRQSFASVWAWIGSELPGYKVPVVEISTDTTLDGTVHNGRILVCSQSVTLMPAFTNMGSGFTCTVINLSAGNVILGAGITTSSGSSVLPVAASASLQGIAYSGGTVIFAAIMTGSTTVGTSGTPNLPGPVTGVIATSFSSNSITLSWLTPGSGAAPTSYAVQYRITGMSSWSTMIVPATPLNCTVTGLAPGSSYDFQVVAVNAAGSGVASSIANATPHQAVPGQVTDLAIGSATLGSLTLAWAAPTSGGTVGSYTIQYRITGTANWSVSVTGVAAAGAVVGGLTSGAQYDFQVTAVNSSGSGIPSAIASGSTSPGAVTSIVWNLAPAGPYVHGSGTIGMNVFVTPAAAAVQFGFSTSVSALPTNWSLGLLVTSNVWAVYAPTPGAAGIWYAWVQGTDGSSSTVHPTGFAVT